jgi:hypothetical protein
MAEKFTSDQKKLPVKLRFRNSSVSEVIGTFVAGAQLLFEKNAHFRSLSLRTRSLLLHKTIKQVGGLSCSFIVNSSKLLDDHGFYQSVEMIYGKASLASGCVAIQRLNMDVVFVKLVLAILLFSTFDCTHDSNKAPMILPDVKAILAIQDIYIELAWRYLLYKYDHRRAVQCFSNLIRSLCALTESLTAAFEVQQYNDMLDTLVKQTEQALRI